VIGGAQQRYRADGDHLRGQRDHVFLLPVEGNKGLAQAENDGAHAYAHAGKQHLNGLRILTRPGVIPGSDGLAHQHAGSARQREGEHGAEVNHGIGDVHGAHHGLAQIADDGHLQKAYQRPLRIGQANGQAEFGIVAPRPALMPEQFLRTDGNGLLHPEAVGPYHSQLNDAGRYRSDGRSLNAHGRQTK